MAFQNAFATLITSDAYLPGALTLVAALKDLHPPPRDLPFQTVAIVTPETLDISTVKLLRKTFDIVVGVEVIQQEDDKGLKLLGRLDLNTVLTKLHVFRLTQYSKIIFLDADILPVRPLSHLFSLPHEFSAVPDVGWPDIFNSGVMVLSPGEDKFAELNQLLKSKGTWDGGDQGILNEWRGGNWNRLSFTYNTTPTAAYTYAPAYERFGSEISAIHFIGSSKPWKSIAYRAPFAQPGRSEDSQRAYDYDSLVDRWFSVYDRHYRSQPISTQPQFEVKHYTPAWSSDNNEEKQLAEQSSNRRIGMDELKRMAIEGLNAYHSHSQEASSEGEYRTLPLEGRLDLMPPKELPKPAMSSSVIPDIVEHTSGSQHHFDAQIDSPRGYFVNTTPSVDEFPTTPHAHSARLDELPLRWHTLPTPGPHELPPPPRHNIIPLPSTHQSWPAIPDTYTPTSESSQPQQGHSESSHRSQEERGQQNQSERGHSSQDNHGRLLDHTSPSNEQHAQEHNVGHQPQTHAFGQPPHQSPPRPASPPLLKWNPALEPPPNTVPTPSAFPTDTYFPNIWDESPTQSKDRSRRQPPDSSRFFKPPPTSDIPVTLLREGHYRNVTGEDSIGSTPSPDRTKVKRVFPWEEKPRQLPGRAFPAFDAPLPSMFLSPESQYSATETSATEPTEFSTPETKATRMPILSPLYGLPSTLTYTNAWDTVPSIQKYASRLARPSTGLGTLDSPFGGEGRHHHHHKDEKATVKPWEDRADASSMDGDVEDEVDEEDGYPGHGNQQGSPRGSLRRRNSAGGSRAKKKEYKDQEVQTVPRELSDQGVQADTTPVKALRDQSVQVTIVAPRVFSSTSTSGSGFGFGSAPLSSRRPLNPMSGAGLLPPFTDRELDLGSKTPTVSSPFPQPTRPRTLSSPMSASPPTVSPRKLSPPPINSPLVPSTPRLKPIRTAPIQAPMVSRQISNDSSLGSPLSSVGPLSPSDGQPISSGRKGGRVWDPKRGVDVFKRGSEEVLARFLRMGSWDDGEK